MKASAAVYICRFFQRLGNASEVLAEHVDVQAVLQTLTSHGHEQVGQGSLEAGEEGDVELTGQQVDLLAAIERSKSQDLSRLIFAFGIRQVGQKAGKILAQRFQTLEALQSAALEELTAVDDIGGITAQNLLSWFSF